MKKHTNNGFRRFFSIFKKKSKPDDLLEIANLIGPIIDALVMDLFKVYSKELLTEPITYIVPAVWGVRKAGVLDATQTEMHSFILPVVNRVQALLDLKTLRDSQKFAVGFIIRGYIISKVTYLVESYRNRVGIPIDMREGSEAFMLKVKPLGTA